MGPLMLPRALFAALGGFNESLSRRGAPSSLLDCELSARVWAAGRAVVTSAWGARPFWPRERSVAWKARGFGRADHATLCTPGCNPMYPRLQPYVSQARGFGRADHRRCLFVLSLIHI